MIDHASLITDRSSTPFYVTGGTLLSEAPCYVVRRADDELHAAVVQGKFCYVLTSRQMGKSSLMVRTAARLREEGVGVAVLDLTAIGQNLSAEQWYDGLVSLVADHLDLEEELDQFWETSYRLGPMQRWNRAIREVVLPKYPGRVVIFIDEIDAVRGLPFSTDEFFAGIREFYNRRTQDSELMRLTFCLLGVATPADLIRDTRTTPFNIGHRVELTDFTEAEAATLASGLERGKKTSAALVKRVLHWTDGHPYLTQRLCQSVAEDSSVNDANAVDRVCEELFLSHRAQERDDNLLFVRERLLRSESDVAALLGLYAKVSDLTRVRDDETNPLVSILRLSGITKVANGYLEVRNRIYSRVFDRQWVKTNMPDAELRRQRAAYRRGLLRAAAIGAVVIAAITALAIVAIKQGSRARQATREAVTQQRTSKSRELAAHAVALMMSDPELSLLLSIEALERFDYNPEAEDALRQSLRESHVSTVLRGHQQGVLYVSFSPDGRLVLTASADHTARIWEASTGTLLDELLGHKDRVNQAAFSPDGELVVTASADHTARVWNTKTGVCLFVLEGHTDSVHEGVFSPDARFVATASLDATVRVWNLTTGQACLVLRGPQLDVRHAAFSPDGTRIITAGTDNTALLWDARTGARLAVLEGHTGAALQAVFSPDGRLAVTASLDNTARVWDARTGRNLRVLRGHVRSLQNATFSPDSKYILTSSDDNTARMWEAATGQSLKEFVGHSSLVHGAYCSPDDRYIVTVSADGTARVWDASTGQTVKELRGHSSSLLNAAFSPDGTKVVTSSLDGTARVWDVGRGNFSAEMRSHSDSIRTVAYSPNGKLVITAGGGLRETVWDASTGLELNERYGPSLSVSSGPFSPYRSFVVGSNRDGTVSEWTVISGQGVPGLRGHTEYFRSPDGKLIISCGADDTARVWDSATRQPLVQLRGHDGEVSSASFSLDSRAAVTVSKDATARVWDVNTGECTAVLRGHTASVVCATFSPDGLRLATASSDTTARVWDLSTGRSLTECRGHRSTLTALAFSPDGKFVATGGMDGTTRLWDAETGKEIERILGRVWGVAFSPDGRSLAIAAGPIARVYPCEMCRPLDELIALAHSRVTRQLTPDERQKYLNESPDKAR